MPFLPLLIIACALLFAMPARSQVQFVNPSFEGTYNPAWMICNEESTPDLQPGQFFVHTPASDGNTYVGLVCRDNNTYEAIAQTLNTPLEKGYCYAFSLDIARAEYYHGYNEVALLRIWGTDKFCNKKEMLWVSYNIFHYEWKTYQVEIAPADTYPTLLFEVYYLPNKLPYRGNVLIDNLSLVKQSPIPTVELGNDRVLCDGDKFTLEVEAPLANILWSDRSTGNTFTVEKEGTYKVKVSNFCSSVEDQINIKYKECPERFVIPNVFTPNGDGINETFFIEGLTRKRWKLEVYNRWGKQVYHNENYQGEWAAENCTIGLYYYQLSKPELPIAKGWVQVLR